MRLRKVKQLTQGHTAGVSRIKPRLPVLVPYVPTTLGRGMGVGQGRWGLEHSRERKSQAQGPEVQIAGGR